MGGLHSRPHGGGYAAARRYRKNRSFVSLSCNTATAMLKHCFSTPRQLSLPSGKSLTVHGCKHRHGFTPSTNRQLPFFHNALKCQVNQLLGGFFMRKHGSSFDYLPNATVESLNLPPKVFFLIMRRHPGVTDITAVILFFRRIIILDKPAVPAESTGATEQALRNPATDGAYRDAVLFGNEAYGDQCHLNNPRLKAQGFLTQCRLSRNRQGF